jgi:hypothetical protein
MWCKLEGVDVPPGSDFAVDPIWGPVHEGVDGHWHTVGGTPLLGHPASSNPSSPSSLQAQPSAVLPPGVEAISLDLRTKSPT